jgi:hypothetical protein
MRKAVMNAAKVSAVAKAGFRPMPRWKSNTLPKTSPHLFRRPSSLGSGRSEARQDSRLEEARAVLTEVLNTVKGENEALIKVVKDKDGNIT